MVKYSLLAFIFVISLAYVLSAPKPAETNNEEAVEVGDSQAAGSKKIKRGIYGGYGYGGFGYPYYSFYPSYGGYYGHSFGSYPYYSGYHGYGHYGHGYGYGLW